MINKENLSLYFYIQLGIVFLLLFSFIFYFKVLQVDEYKKNKKVELAIEHYTNSKIEK